MDVFISWTRADEEVKNALVAKLQEENISYADSDEFCTEDYSTECIEAIDRCKVFIVIVSDASMQGGYVLNEVIHARKLEDQGKLNFLVYKITDAPYSAAFNFQMNHISAVFGNLVRGGMGGVENIIKRAKLLLEKRKNGKPEMPFDVSLPQVDGMQIVPPGYFVEHSRDDALAALDAGFARSNVVVLKELFGYGKRATVKKYAQLHSQDYDSQVIVQNENATLREFFLATLQFSNVNSKLFAELEGEARIREKLKFLKKLDRRHLLVISDVRFEATPDTRLFEALKNLDCHIIITTQESAAQFRDWFPVVDLGRMEDKHLKELFFHHYDYAYEEEQQALDGPLTQYFSEIGGHTKTVELTASVLSQEWGVHPEDIPEYLNLRGCEGMQLKDRILKQLDYLLDVDKLTPDERTALLVAAYVAVPYVSEKKFRKVLENLGVTNWQCVTGLDKRRWLDMDMRNRTVSMEPLIAQIVIGKIRDEGYAVAHACYNYWAQNVITGSYVSISNESTIKEIDKMAHLLSNTGIPEAGLIMKLLSQYMVDVESVDPARMKAAIQNYEKQYPTRPLESWDSLSQDRAQLYRLIMKNTDAGDLAGWRGSEEDYGALTHMLGAYEENYPEAYPLLQYELSIMLSMTNSWIPQAKSIAAEISLFDWDAASALSAEQADMLSFSFEDILGISREEVQRLLLQLRQSMEEDEDFDEDDGDYLICIEMIAAMDAIYRRDRYAMMESLHSAIRAIFMLPQDGQENSAGMLYVVAQLAAMIFISLDATHSAVLLCEELLTLETNHPQRNGLVKMYIQALRRCHQYGDALYQAYEEGLRIFASTSAEFFDGREESQAEEKQWRLQYAEDLARGGRMEQAEAMFAQAEKRGAYLKAPETLQTAEWIADKWIQMGAFEKAVSFADRYLEGKSMIKLWASGIAKEDPALANLMALREICHSAGVESAAGEDPLRYVDYYSQFSRDHNALAASKYYVIADKAMKFDFSRLSDQQLLEQAQELKRRARRCKPLELAPEAFALAGEAGMRTLGYRYHYVQYMGAAVMADGKVAEILNGEGKTYTVVAVAFLRYLYDQKVLVVDNSPYLTERNYNWMRPVYQMLGMTCAHMDDELAICKKRNADQADVIYVSLRNLMFGYLHSETEPLFQREFMAYDCAIIDEIDSVLVDGAQERYQLSAYGDQSVSLEYYDRAWELAGRVANNPRYYTYNDGAIVFNRPMLSLIEETFRVSYSDVALTQKLKELEEMMESAILCRCHYEEGENYHIVQGRPVRENKQKGIFEPMLQVYEYFLCKKHGLSTYAVEQALCHATKAVNMIAVRDMFKKFKTVCGTTATAISFRAEFKEIYGLEYVAVPPEKPCVRKNIMMPLYISLQDKERAIVEMIFEKNMNHQPVLLICQTVQESEHFHFLLSRAGIPHQLLNARNIADSSRMLSRAGEWDSVLIATFLVNRGADIKLGGDAQLRTRLEMMKTGANVSQLQQILEKNRKIVAEEKRRVIAAGGLCVIGTSFFADAREEQQTRGRAGRQGDVGESYVFWSLGDMNMKRLLSEQAIETLQRRMQLLGVTENDSKILKRTYQSAQRRLHESAFARIRSTNDTSAYLDENRGQIVGRIWDIRSGDLTVEALCREWAKHPRTLQNLSRFQEGDAQGLFRFLEGNGAKLRSVRGRKAEQQLFEVLCQETVQWESLGKYRQDRVKILIQSAYRDAWARFVQAVLAVSGKEHVGRNVILKQIRQIKEDICYEVLEKVLQSCIQ